MKIATVLGTRPEIIRLSQIIPKLDNVAEHVLVHTGQNFDQRLSDIFFDELGLRRPDHHLNVKGTSAADQIGQILVSCERVFQSEKPDRLLVLGDTNSALCAIVAKRLSIPVFHMEAGNRCYDDRVPEETNRRLIDHSSDILLPYTERSRANLLREGIASNRILVTGNPILEVIEANRSAIDGSDVIERLGLVPGKFFLVTLHRAENVDIDRRLSSIVGALQLVGHRYDQPVIVSTHPRMAFRLREFGLLSDTGHLRFPEPFGLFDFVHLESKARCVLSDSGTVQEECAIFGIPNVTLRDVTERPETLECGSNILSGAGTEMILQCVAQVLGQTGRWRAPAEYLVSDVSDRIARIMTGFHLGIGRKAGG